MKLPSSWHDLKINQFIELRAALEMRDVDALDRNVLIVSALINKSVEWVEANMSLSDLTNVIANCKFTSELPSGNTAKYFWLGGKLWRVDLDVSKIIPAQYIDLSLITKTEDDVIDNMHKIMSIFCRPISQSKYDSVKAEKHAQLFYQKMSSHFAYTTAVFFYHLFNELFSATQTYLVEQAKAIAMELKNESQLA